MLAHIRSDNDRNSPDEQFITGDFRAGIDHNLVCADHEDIEEEMKTMDKISLMLILLIMIVTIFCCCYCC